MEEFLESVKKAIADFDDHLSKLVKTEPHTTQWENTYQLADGVLAHIALLLLDKALDSDTVRKWQTHLDTLRTRLAAVNLSAITDDRNQSTQIIDANVLQKQVQIGQMCDAIDNVLRTFNITLQDLINFRTVMAAYSLGDMVALNDLGGCCEPETHKGLTTFTAAIREADRGVIDVDIDDTVVPTEAELRNIEDDLANIVNGVTYALRNAQTSTQRAAANISLSPAQLKMYKLVEQHNKAALEAHRRLQAGWKLQGRLTRLSVAPRFIVPL